MNNDFDKEELARQILQTSTWDMKKISLPSKSGYKFFHKLKEDEEEARLGSYFNSHFEHHAMMKTNKLANMGLAEWLPELKVAKIVKEAKFMQRMGRPHREKFLFLFAEEALYLLDTGCIELNLNDVPLAMDRARELLMCHHRVDDQELLVTPDEYKLYAWLTRLGFVLQRHNIPNIIRKAKPYHMSNCTNSGGASSSKKPRIETDAEKNETDAIIEGAIMHDNPEKENLAFYTLSTFEAVHEDYSNVVFQAIPDLKSPSLTLDSKDFPSNSGVTSISFDLNDFQPFDIVCTGAKVKEEFYFKYREMVDAALSCSDWKTYKESIKATRNFHGILANDKQTLIDKHTLLDNPQQVLDRPRCLFIRRRKKKNGRRRRVWWTKKTRVSFFSDEEEEEEENFVVVVAPPTPSPHLLPLHFRRRRPFRRRPRAFDKKSITVVEIVFESFHKPPPKQ